jgi:hypothetical protein
LARPLQVKKQKKKEGEGGKKQEAASSQEPGIELDRWMDLLPND